MCECTNEGDRYLLVKVFNYFPMSHLKQRILPKGGRGYVAGSAENHGEGFLLQEIS